MINSINILEMQEGEIKRSIGGFANPFNNKITINENINDMEDTLIHEIGHTFTFDLAVLDNKYIGICDESAKGSSKISGNNGKTFKASLLVTYMSW